MLRKLLYVLFGLSLIVASCKHDAPIPVNAVEDNYPPEVAKIIIGKCVSCHNEKNAAASGNLRLDTWGKLFEGGNNGSAVVPYSTDYSPLLYFINTDSALGVVSEPRMPNGQGAQPLSKDEYKIIADWVASGAPDKKGNIPFGSDAATRQKIYMTQQGCDLVSVIDAKSKLVMRVLKVGKGPQITDVPHSVRTTKDGRYAFVSFNSSGIIQRIDATTDAVLPYEQLTSTISTPQWNILHPNDDGSKVVVTDYIGGAMRYIDYEKNTSKLIAPLPGAHGIAAVPSFDTFYVTGQAGNQVYKVNIYNSNVKVITLDNNAPTTQNAQDPHEIVMSPDNTKLFVTCQRTGDVRVIDRATDAVIKIIPVGLYPQEIALAKSKPYMLITCQEDNPHKVGNASFKGSVHIINLNTLEKVGVINGDFAGCHGVTVDDQNGLIYIASRNVGGSGVAPHHTTNCGGANGYYNVYDLNTLLPAPNKRFEVTPDPYSLDTRFK